MVYGSQWHSASLFASHFFTILTLKHSVAVRFNKTWYPRIRLDEQISNINSDQNSDPTRASYIRKRRFFADFQIFKTAVNPKLNEIQQLYMQRECGASRDLSVDT